MTYPSEDIVTYLEGQGIGKRMSTLFTPSDQGAFDGRPLAAVVREISTSASPDVTVNADILAVSISVSGTYGQQGEQTVMAFANSIYRELRLLTDITIDGTLYYCVQAQGPPSHAGYDEFGRTVYEMSVDIYRYLGVV